MGNLRKQSVVHFGSGSLTLADKRGIRAPLKLISFWELFDALIAFAQFQVTQLTTYYVCLLL